MRITTRIRRLGGGVAVGALLMAVFPAGIAGASQHAAVCDGAPADVFDDVDPGNVHAANIDCIAAYGITTGVGGDDYAPGSPISRAQMATFLVTLAETALQTEFAVPDDSPFTDIDGNTHEDNIKIAEEQGITAGVTPTTFAPQEDVRRDQMASFVANAIERAVGGDLPAAGDAFTDVDGNTHEDNIEALAAASIVSGIGDDRYDPAGDVRRDQMATFLAHAAGFLDGQDLWGATLTPEPASFTDAPELLDVQMVNETSTDVRLRFVFDEPVLPDPSSAAFHLVRGDTMVSDADAATREAGATAHVLADFPRTAYDQATVAAVSAGAVQDSDALTNPEGDRPLQGVTYEGGITDEADLVDVTFGDFGAELLEGPAAGLEVAYTFDQELADPQAATASGFQLVRSDGTVVTGATNESESGASDTVTIGFTVATQTAADDLEAATRRAHVERDASGQDNPLQSVDLAESGTTDGPDLTDVTFAGDDLVTFTFDQNVLTGTGDVDADAFSVVRIDGTRVTGTLDTVDGRDVTIQFAAGEVNDTLVIASVGSGAVVATDATVGAADSIGVEQLFPAGTTVGPVLESVTIEVNETSQLDGTTQFDDIRVAYTFDTEIDVAAGFALYGADGVRYDLGDASTLPAGAFDCTATDETVECVSEGSANEANAALEEAVLGGSSNDAVVSSDVAAFTSHPSGQEVS